VAREREFNRRNGGPFVWGLWDAGSLASREMSYSIIAKCYIDGGRSKK
jgi:hypothetical protein